MKRVILYLVIGYTLLFGIVTLTYRSLVHGRPDQADVTAPEAAPQASPTKVAFVEVAKSSGLDFTHTNGAFGKHYLPETNGSGAAFLDYDNDGDQDVVLVNTGNWPFHESAKTPDQPTHAFFQNDGIGNFTDVTREVGLDFSSFGMGVCAGDIDNDGFIDIYIAGYNGNRLLRNDAGKRFVDVTEEAGVEAGGMCNGAAFLDYDRDGRLDLFVGQYFEWSLELEARLEAADKGRPRLLYRSPNQYDGGTCFLFHNRDGLHFEDVSAASGVQVKDARGEPTAKALGIATQDFNDDGWPDIAVANDQAPDFLFRNRGDGTFINIAGEAGTAADASGFSRSGMGVAWADYRNDGSIALVITNFSTQMAGLYLSPGENRKYFFDVATMAGIGSVTRPPVGWGVCFFDYDLDGWLDLYMVSGHLGPDYERLRGEPYAQAAQLFWNRGNSVPDRLYVELTAEHVGEDLFKPIVGRGAIHADIDGDGDLDLLATTNDHEPCLYRNEGGTGNHFLRVKLEGRESNRSAVGAKLRLRTGDLWQRREVATSSSYLSQNEMVQTFGLGKRTIADELVVAWPSGKKETFTAVKADQTLHLIEGRAQDTPPPQ